MISLNQLFDMLFHRNNTDIDLKLEVRKKCGKSISFLERILTKNYGSSKYKLENIFPDFLDKKKFKFNESVFLNFDLREFGIVFCFRIKNNEYIEFCPYYLISFQSNDNNFTLQTDYYSYSFRIMDKKKHLNFISSLYKKKVKYNSTNL